MAEREGCTCQCCGRKYTVDFLVPDDLWQRIKPAGSAQHGGLLCGSCIVHEIEQAVGFGAYLLRTPPQQDAERLQAVLNECNHWVTKAGGDPAAHAVAMRTTAKAIRRVALRTLGEVGSDG